MNKNTKVKKFLLYTILILLTFLILGILLTYFFLFKKIEWKYSYENDTVKYLYENMYKISKNHYVGTGYIYEIVEMGDNFIIGTLPYENEMKLVLEKDKIGKRESFEYVGTKFGTISSIFFDIKLVQDRGDIFKILKCTFGDKEKCTASISLSQIDMYQNEYPYSTLSIKESNNFVLYNIERYEKKEKEIEATELRCNDSMSEYIISKDKKILEEIQDLDCENYPNNILYANLLNDKDPLYGYIKNGICTSSIISNSKDIFTPFVGKLIASMCNIEFTGVSEDSDYKDGEQFFPRNILFLLNQKDSKDYENKLIQTKKEIAEKWFTTFLSPYCTIDNKCSIELINLSKIILNE